MTEEEEGELAGEGSGYWYDESARLAADGAGSGRSVPDVGGCVFCQVGDFSGGRATADG